VRVVCLSGGVGGAKLAAGLYDVLHPGELTVVVNVGDDVEVLGLHVSPDLDSVLYALAGLNDVERGWGRRGETWNALEAARAWGGEGWFALGDLDLGLHLVRTQLLRAGASLTAATASLVAAAGLETTLLPGSDDPVRTRVVTPDGTFAFQEWFVGRQHRDEVDAVVYEGIESARPAPGVLDAIAAADLVVLAPSNPYVSLLPVLGIPGVGEALAERSCPCVAVSPLIGGRAVKGPLDRMLRRMAGDTSPAAIAALYPGLLDALVVDTGDAGAAAAVPLVAADTLITDRDAARRLARRTLEVA
jgi:LPPG:FO 2-phospho-L-lactate transferase